MPFTEAPKCTIKKYDLATIFNLSRYSVRVQDFGKISSDRENVD